MINQRPAALTIAILASLMLSNYGHTTERQSASDVKLHEMSLDDLLLQRVELYRDSKTASGTNETIRNSPAAMVVINAEDIKRRGYDSLDEIMDDLPGFDTIVTNGTMQVVSYQRGYRTPWTQRTLLLVNGRVDNNLWNHSAQLSRQYPINIIERIEVLYGPAGAVYGPNAFLGVINIITKDSRELASGESYLKTTFSAGSYSSSSVDLAAGGREGDLYYNFGGRLFSSHEADINDYSSWGFTNPELLSDASTWGVGIGEGVDPVTSVYSPPGDINVNGTVDPFEQFNGKSIGRYEDPSDNIGVMGELGYKQLKAGYLYWKTDEGYGPYYSFADAQPNSSWFHESRQFYIEHNGKTSSGLSVDTDVVYRSSQVYGDWVESFGGSVSISDWNSYNTAVRIEQKYRYTLTDTMQLNGGIKYEKKTLTKTYMICNYFDGLGICPDQAAGSVNGAGSDGSGVVDAADIDSSNFTSFPPTVRGEDIPGYNSINTKDIGAYIQGIWDFGRTRYNLSLRVDDNSEYGTEINPRGAFIYHSDAFNTYKIIYGEAFQEPAPKDLYGDFNGRLANSELKPEKVRNIEFVIVNQGKNLLSDSSLFYANYQNAIASGDNVGGRDIYGFEYRGKYRLPNFLKDSSDITGNIFYTYTRAMSDRQYDNVAGQWIDERSEQGDIAPHKVNFMVNIPVGVKYNVNLMANWLSSRDLFSQNPLRKEFNSLADVDTKAEAYTKVDINILYQSKDIEYGLKIENIFEEEYLLPGVESASSGTNFQIDNDGFQNSLLPQVKDRVYMIYLTVKL